MKTLRSAVVLLVLAVLFPGAVCRRFPELVSDGVEENEPIRLRGTGLVEDKCEQMYGFLPCSETIPGHLFLILVYEYLLFHAESYVASGGKRIFKILGPGVFGASAFQIIGSLPEALFLLASGLSDSNETAEECVLTGVGLLAGSSILLLTVIWGTCVILGSQEFSRHLDTILSENKDFNSLERFLFSLWPSYGVVTVYSTNYTSRIMLLSVIPLIMIQTPSLLRLSYAAERNVLLITLVVSMIFLFCYFFYQLFQPSIQRSRLMYIKHEHLVLDVLNHVQDQTMGKLLNENGSPNVSAIKRLFEERDRNGDKAISLPELQEFLQEMKCRNLQLDNDNTAAEIMKEFDVNNDQKITMEEFVRGMTRWLDDTKDAMDKRYHSVKSLKDLYQVLKPWIQNKKEEREMMTHLIPDILEYLQNFVYGSLLAEDRTPDIQAIKGLFKHIDLDKDGCISNSELKELMNNIRFGIIPYNAEVVASKLMKELDLNEDEVISEEEFVVGLSKWLSTTYSHSPNSKENEDDSYQKTWEQIDELMEDKFIDKSTLAWMKAIALIVVGLVMLGVLAEPLIQSVRGLSTAASLPSFYVAFVIVPLATNARIAVSTIKEARKKKLRLTSLALSEIYGTVFMNNILGLVVLLSLIYFRGIAWNFSVEVLIVLIVSSIVGCFASFNRVYPIWTSISACLMYPLSLVLVYILGDFYSSS